jgi:PTS system nitrogen regulatory IIA component
MKLHSLLNEDLVLTPLMARDRDGALREMVEHLRGWTQAALDGDLLEKLLAREGLGTTAIGGGVAVPHCKVGGLKAPLVMLGLSKDGLSFQSLDGQATHVIFLVISPLEYPNANLRVLAAIAKLVRKSGTLASKLLKAPTAREALRTLRDEEEGGHAS